jgi:glycosyltransferase involved in cell wall biosynthesis
MALKGLEEPLQPEIILLATQGTPTGLYSFLDGYIDNLVFIPETKWQRYMKSFYLRIPYPKWLEKLVVPHRVLITQLRNNHVDVIFTNDEYGPFFPVPLLAWIPDFQHIHIPDLFSSSKIQTRNRHNDRISRFASRVILSSQDAYHDLKRVLPKAVDKARVLSFVAQIPAGVYDVDSAKVCELYHLPNKFFYLPNQFWKHKNHTVVIEALTLLKERCPEMVVVCTGNPSEFRGHRYYQQLVATIHESNLDHRMILLGLVPHEHIFQLMRRSLAVLQPSLFEGWSTTVEEAKSLGKGLIISDIPVHKEQDPPGSIFFDPHNPQMLANILVDAYTKKLPGSDVDLETTARKNFRLRTQQFGEDFINIAREVVVN